jgi:hypothetical protein
MCCPPYVAPSGGMRVRGRESVPARGRASLAGWVAPASQPPTHTWACCLRESEPCPAPLSNPTPASPTCRTESRALSRLRPQLLTAENPGGQCVSTASGESEGCGCSCVSVRRRRCGQCEYTNDRVEGVRTWIHVPRVFAQYSLHRCTGFPPPVRINGALESCTVRGRGGALPCTRNGSTGASER